MKLETRVHVVGVGTIGEPVLRLLLRHRDAFGISRLSFHKRSARRSEVPKLASLIKAGAELAAAPDTAADFRFQGLTPTLSVEEALEGADVILDCSEDALGRRSEYSKLERARGIIAQGSEHGFGKPYALGVNDDAIDPEEDRFLHVVSCNTHNLSALIRALTRYPADLSAGRFLCIRRANDVGQENGRVGGIVPSDASDHIFGTHHARDVHDLFATLGHDLPLFSSAVKVPTPFMHGVWFSLSVQDPRLTTEVAKRRLAEDRLVALTFKRSSNAVFSAGRDRGAWGRIFSQTVVPLSTVNARAYSGGSEVTGFCFTPQDGNSLLSTVAAAVRFLHPQSWEQRMEAAVTGYLLQEV